MAYENLMRDNSASGMGLSGFDQQQGMQQSQPSQQAPQSSSFNFAAPQYNNAPSIQLGQYTANPFLADMFKGIEQQGTQNLQNNVLPGVRYGAMAAGGFGGTRQGIAEGNAIGQSQSAISAQKAQVGQADYNSSQDRALQKYSADSASAASQAASSNSFNLGMAQLAQSGRQFDMTNATQNRQFDASNALAGRQVDNSYNLGMGNLGVANRQTDNSYALGQGNLGVANRQTDNSYALGQGNLANANRQTDNSYNLGVGNLGLGFTQANNSYNLGMGNLALGNTQANNNFYTANRGQDLQSVSLGAQLYGQGNAGYVGQGAGIQGIGNAQQQAPWQTLDNASNVFKPYTGLNSSSTTSQPGSVLGGIAGGATIGAQLGNLWNSGSSNYGSGITGSGGWSTQGGQYNNPSAY